MDLFVDPSPDPLRSYSLEEQRQLTTNLLALVTAIARGEFGSEMPSAALLCRLHAAIFTGVRDHAGRTRRRGEGSERLVFGPFRSAHRDMVEGELAATFDRTATSLRSLDDHREDPEYERSAIHTAVWTHAEIIRIHPFEDGNGRTSRALLDLILVRQGLRPISVDATKDEYVAVLNHFHYTKDLKPLRSLFVRLAAEQLGHG